MAGNRIEIRLNRNNCLKLSDISIQTLDRYRFGGKLLMNFVCEERVEMTKKNILLKTIRLATIISLCVCLFLFAIQTTSISFASSSSENVSNENELRQAIATLGNSAKTIKLTQDIELISNFIIPSGANVILTSSGSTMHSLISTRDMDVITIQANVNLTIENIKITHTPGTKGRGIVSENGISGARNGTSSNTMITLNSGEVSGNSATSANDDSSGGIDTYGAFVMNGGTIKDNYSGGWWTNGDVHIAGPFTMNGGTISGVDGGGVSYSGSFTMNKGTINGNVNSPTWSRADNSAFIMNGGTINGDLNHGGGYYNGITIKGGVINGNITTKDGLGNNNGLFDMSGGTINGTVTVNRGTMSDGTISGGLIVAGTGTGKVFSMNGGTITNSEGAGVRINSWGPNSFVMNGGTITGNSGAGVTNTDGIYGQNSMMNVFTMNGGTISKNGGGGVVNGKNGIFEMNGGVIKENSTTSNGGGVDTAGVFVINCGAIYDNIADGSGGGVNQASGTFTFDGGWIYNNKAGNGNDISIAQSGVFNNNVLDNKFGSIGSPPPTGANICSASTPAPTPAPSPTPYPTPTSTPISSDLPSSISDQPDSSTNEPSGTLQPSAQRTSQPSFDTSIVIDNGWRVSSGWGEDTIKRSVELDLIPDALNENGIDFTRPINRMEFAGVAVRAYERLSGVQVVPTQLMPFIDTNDIDVQKAYTANIMIGYSDTEFEPLIQLNREQAATALTRVFKRYHFLGWTYETDADFPLDFIQPTIFSDDAFISDWAKQSVYFMAANEIILGIGNNLFAPSNRTTFEEAEGYATATREQALAIAVRIIDNLSSGDIQLANDQRGDGIGDGDNGGAVTTLNLSLQNLRVTGLSLAPEERYCSCGGYYTESIYDCEECGYQHYYYTCWDCWNEEFGYSTIGYCCLCDKIGCIHWSA